MGLHYEKKSDGKLITKARVYSTESLYMDPARNKIFLQLKANICDLNPALVTKCITGTEQDFIMLMHRARDYLQTHHPLLEETENLLLLEMFRQCIFGYYVLTPLLESMEVSDIKVLDYNHICVKANGERYVSDIRFFDEED